MSRPIYNACRGLCTIHNWGAPPGQDDWPCPFCLSDEIERLRQLCAESQELMSEDFPEDPAELDDACVSPRYLAHYKALLALEGSDSTSKGTPDGP